MRINPCPFTDGQHQLHLPHHPPATQLCKFEEIRVIHVIEKALGSVDRPTFEGHDGCFRYL